MIDEHFTIAQDLPRVLRSDMTRLTEWALKLRGAEAHLVGESAPDMGPPTEASRHLAQARQHLLGARAALEAALGALQDAGAPAYTPGASAEAGTAEARPDFVHESKGKGDLLVNVIGRAGIVSSGKARRGVVGGFVRLGGEVVTDPNKVLDPGTYVLQVGDQDARIIEVR